VKELSWLVLGIALGLAVGGMVDARFARKRLEAAQAQTDRCLKIADKLAEQLADEVAADSLCGLRAPRPQTVIP
jgi:hypothetical protein